VGVLLCLAQQTFGGAGFADGRLGARFRYEVRCFGCLAARRGQAGRGVLLKQRYAGHTRGPPDGCSLRAGGRSVRRRHLGCGACCHRVLLGVGHGGASALARPLEEPLAHGHAAELGGGAQRRDAAVVGPPQRRRRRSAALAHLAAAVVCVVQPL
jgi:hypothetical protein